MANNCALFRTHCSSHGGDCMSELAVCVCVCVCACVWRWPPPCCLMTTVPTAKELEFSVSDGKTAQNRHAIPRMQWKKREKAKLRERESAGAKSNTYGRLIGAVCAETKLVVFEN